MGINPPQTYEAYSTQDCIKSLLTSNVWNVDKYVGGVAGAKIQSSVAVVETHGGVSMCIGGRGGRQNKDSRQHGPGSPRYSCISDVEEIGLRDSRVLCSEAAGGEGLQLANSQGQ